jgi:glutaconyl-CoA/methylmalonyl-CoA decarboxylase subunit gamma
MKLTIGDKSYEIDLTADGVRVDGEEFRASVDGYGGTRIVTVNGRPVRVDVGAESGGTRPVTVEGRTMQVGLEAAPARVFAPAPTSAQRPVASAAPVLAVAVKGAVTAQMTGRIVRIDVQPGQTVASGDLLLILEAMKMENEIRSSRAGTVKELRVAPGDRVNKGDPLVVLDE